MRTQDDLTLAEKNGTIRLMTQEELEYNYLVAQKVEKEVWATLNKIGIFTQSQYDKKVDEENKKQDASKFWKF